MCGIHLIVQKGGFEKPDSGPIHRMVQSLKHRGPDGMDVIHLDWGEEQIWLGHNLLAISAEKEESRQPMVSNDGSCGIVFNGQVYNQMELRARLKEDGIVCGPSDSAVLLSWIQKHGRKGLRKLVGMFAFVFWDSEKRLLIIHRDGYGIKPLFLARNRHFFAISSEPKALFSSGLFSFSVDYRAIAYYLKYKFIPPPFSYWVGIKPLFPGEVIEYWEGKPMHFQIHFESTNQDVLPPQKALDTAFSSIIPTNEPVGLMFSGGLDSTLILSWCLRNNIQVKPYSIRFLWPENQTFHDQNSAEMLAKKFGVDIEWVDLDQEKMKELLAFPAADLPLIADSAWWLTWLISERAKSQGIRILLSGAGADEWFGGYRRHWFYYQWQKLNQFIPGRWQLSLLKKLQLTNPLNHKDKSPQLSDLVWDAGVSSRLTGYIKSPPILPHEQNTKSMSDLQAGLIWDQTEYLPNDVLALTDFATMAHGIEGRFPFLHPALTVWAESHSAEQRLEDGRKHLLFQFLDSELQTFFKKRKKQGFGVPMQALFESEFGAKFLKENISNQQKLFEPWFDSTKWSEFIQNWKPGKMPQESFALAWLAQWLTKQPKANS